MNKLKAFSLGILMALSGPSMAGIIDFETTASGETPTDNLAIEFTDRFDAGGVSVRFGFDSDGDGSLDTRAVFEESGNRDPGKDTGFWGIGGARDAAAPSYEDQLGRFFLRQRDPYQPFGIFTILYDADNPVTAASGEIWDIDGNGHPTRKTEQYLVQAFNDDDLLAEIFSPLGTDWTLDGKPWTFGFTGLSDIERIEITFTGSKTNGIGLAFNNFSPTQSVQSAQIAAASVPVPSSAALFALGLLCIAGRRIRALL